MLPYILKSMGSLNIIRTVQICDNKVVVDGNNFLEGTSAETSPFFKEIYKKLDLKYSKFFKMDLLSKLGILSTEILLNGETDIPRETDKVALVFANASSSLNTDSKYQESISDIPSPAVFVYTLPNIVIGEISIKHKYFGEHMFFVQKEFNKKPLEQYTETLFKTTSATYAIVGWLEVNVDGDYNAQLSLCSKN